MDWIDLTRPLTPGLPPFRHGDYADPPLRITPWCGIADQGFAVDHLSLGGQTGTHIDAPAHFAPGGTTLEALPAATLIGRYAYVSAAMLAAGQAPLGAGRILYLDALDGPDLPEAGLAALLARGDPVWVMAGAARVAGRDGWHLHRVLAQAGRFLVEDLDPAAARAITGPGQIAALPLRLIGTTGAPARVMALPDRR
ncbi:cyclase family protein [Paracoccus sp. p4-l81]|uniref:cyclase family protein n=1 Tax=unclassified Paracoccus (in: a-proteobacteria) TaxID=2688777 RepID=UPI0035B8F125